MTHTLTLADLSNLAATTAQINYNVDSADTLTFDILPEAYTKFAFAYGDRITITRDGSRVFSGMVTTAPAHAVSAGSNESVTISAQSDFYTLERTAYAKIKDDGTPVYPGIFGNAPTTAISSFMHGIFSYAANWTGSTIESTLVCNVSGMIPTPSGNATTPCAQLLRDALKWRPDAFILQRYSADGDTLTVATTADFAPIQFTDEPIANINLQAKPELIPPVCALVGSVHAVYPAGGDVRQPGAFIYAVPPDSDSENQPAGTSPASQKMILKGVPVPDRHHYKYSSQEYNYTTVIQNSDTYKFFKKCFPDYADFLPYAQSGSAFIFVTPKADLITDATDTDEETQKPPANYSETPANWASGNSGVYVMTEGSFTASANRKKNIKSLSWCKAKITVMLAIPRSGIPAVLHSKAAELFPGMVKINGNKHAFARLTLDCVLINRRKRVFDPATNSLLRTDPVYQEEPPTEDSLTAADYRAAMQNYYNASRTIYHEGNIALFDDGTYSPHTLTGRSVTIQGKRAEWENMNAIIRSVGWNLKNKMLSIVVGTRGQLSFDEYLERRRLNRKTADNAAQNLAVPFDTADTEAQEEAESEMTVSPTISPGMVPAVRGRARKPGTLYPVITDNADGTQTQTWWLAGGVIRKGNTAFQVEDTAEQLTNGVANGTPWTYGQRVKVRFKYDANRNVTSYDIYQ